MAWPGQNNEKPDADDQAGKSRFAVPPACPRCELTKSQMNRTIQNYQKAYRKKVEGLKAELTTVRADNQHLKRQVKSLRRKRLTHLPSVVIGAGIAVLVGQLVKRIQEHRKSKSTAVEAPAGAAVPEADTPAQP